MAIRIVTAVSAIVVVLVAAGLPASAESVIGLSDITADAAPGQNGAIVAYSLPGSFAQAGAACTWASGATFPVGKTSVFCQAGSGPARTVGSFTVTVRAAVDRQPPVIDTPGSVSVSAPAGTSGTSVTYRLPVASDNGASVGVSCSPPSGGYFPVGSTTVNCSAADAAGNTARVQFVVQVSGQPAPQPIPGPPGTTRPPAAPVPGTVPGEEPGSPLTLPGPGRTTLVPGACFPCATTTSTTTSTSVPPTTGGPTTTPLTVSPFLVGDKGETFPEPAGAGTPSGRGGGPSPALVAAGCLAVLAALMVVSLIARRRFDHDLI